MVHIIPLSVAQRRSDAGNAEHPDASPAGGAARPFDAEWQALAEHYRQRAAQQQAFDTEIAARRLDGEIAGAEADIVANAAADGEGLHHAMYGEVDRRTGRVVEKGRFDTLFDSFVKQAPAGLRAGLASRKETLRAAGSARMATQQLQRRARYEQEHLAAVQVEELDGIAKGDPDDPAAFDAARNAGLNLIARMNLDPESRLKAEADWRESTARTRIEALIARDPRRALEMLGGGAVASDRTGNPGIQPLAGLSPEDTGLLLDQPREATAPRLAEARANTDFAAQNAPDAIADTGSYSGAMPSAADFTAVYGPEDGDKRHQDFKRKIDVGRQVFGMRTMPNQAIHAALRDAEPGPGSSQDERERHDMLKKAISRNLAERADDPGGYVSRTFPDVLAAWDDASRNADYQNAIDRSVAAQRQLGIEDIQPLPNSTADDIARTMMAEYAASGKIGNVRKIFQGINGYEKSIILQIILRSAILGVS